MAFELIVALSAGALLIGMLLLAEMGRRIGLARFKRGPDGAGREGGAAEAAAFGLLGLRAMATQTHPPTAIFLLLGALCLVGALLIGHGASQSKGRHWFHPIVFATIMSATVYVIVDIEYPRLGLIRVDAADHILLDLRTRMQ